MNIRSRPKATSRANARSRKQAPKAEILRPSQTARLSIGGIHDLMLAVSQARRLLPEQARVQTEDIAEGAMSTLREAIADMVIQSPAEANLVAKFLMDRLSDTLPEESWEVRTAANLLNYLDARLVESEKRAG